MNTIRRKSKIYSVAIAASFAFLLALGGVALLVQFSGGNDEVAEKLDDTEQEDVLASGPPAAPHQSAGSSTSEEAIEAFLDAEAADDWRASFDLLSHDDRQLYLTPDQWAARRDGVLGSVEGWSWIESDRLATDVQLLPSASPANGVTPPAATVDWVTADEDGWRVALSISAITPRLPSDELASTAVADWLNVGCGTRAEDKNFFGSHPTLAEQACTVGLSGGPEALKPIPPKGRVAGELGVMFGVSAADSLRAIPLAEPSNTSIIVAPQLEGWTVIDVLPDL